MATMATTVTMVIKPTMVTMVTMHLSTMPLPITLFTLLPTTPHHHLTTLLAVSLELQADLAQMVLADLDPEALVKEALAQLALV